MQGNQLELIDIVSQHNETAQNLVNKKATQEDRIYEYLQTGRSLTPLEALDMFGCLRLASRISDLKRKGIPVITETVYNNGKHYARYHL